MPVPAASPAPAPPGVVPILYYHRVESVPGAFDRWTRDRRHRFLEYDVLPAAFEAQLDWLAEHGYATILPRDLAAHWDLGAPLPARPVILTFDDGYRSWITTVLPALRRRGMVAEFYLTLGAIRKRNLHWSDVRLLARAGMGIGAHDVHHVQLAGLPGGRARPARVMWQEVSQARTVIAAQVGVAPDSMAYVGGGFDDTLVALVRRAGYSTARSIQRGIVQRSELRYQLRVVRIGARDDVIDVASESLVDGLPAFVARLSGRADARSPDRVTASHVAGAGARPE